MEHQAPYRNKVAEAGCVLLFIFLIWSNTPYAARPVSWVTRNNRFLSQKRGILYYHQSPYTGLVYEKYPDGHFALQMPYTNGKQDGVMKSWYPNHVLQQERLFTEGKKQGLHKGWWANGRAAFEYHFTDDEYNGTVKEWDGNGKPYRAFHYSMGHENGRQQMWWPDGSVRANYVVRNGQQYGLIGRKLCRNVIK